MFVLLGQIQRLQTLIVLLLGVNTSLDEGREGGELEEEEEANEEMKMGI